MLKARENVTRIPQIPQLSAGRDGICLDLNENTAGCSPRVLSKLRSLTAADVSLYPDKSAGERIVAAHLGVAPDQLLLTNGIDEAILLLFHCFLGTGDEALYPVPAFPMYPICACAAGATTVEARMERDFRFPTQQMLLGITPRTRMIAIANPNNPTGTLAPRTDLARILAAAPQAAVLLDEAYFEFCGETMLGELPRFPNLFVARTFSKVYGLAALRLGCLVGAAEHMAMVRRLAPPFSVNGVALACLPEALADREHVENCVAALRHERARLEAELSKYGIRTWPSGGNFLLADLGDKHTTFTAELEKDRIYVRDRGKDPACSGCVRITVGTAEEMDRLYTALPGALQRSGWRPTS